MERYYDDGTEPDIMPHLDRYTEEQPPKAAEAATDIGCDDDDSVAHPLSYLAITIGIVCAIAAVVFFTAMR